MPDKARGPFRTEILSNDQVTSTTRVITISRPPEFAEPGPGQFVSIKPGPGPVPLLRRPYSIMDADEWSLKLMVKVVGEGSRIIASGAEGDIVDLIGPLGGTEFELPEGEDAVFVAGGTGLAPLVFASRKWRSEGRMGKASLLFGSSCRDELLIGICGEDFDDIHEATMDGSAGYSGDVARLLEGLVRRGAVQGGWLFTCGPSAMVRAIVKKKITAFKAHQTSLETMMACGVGACRGCVVPVKVSSGPRYRSVCQEGTVFMAEEIDWEDWKE